MENKEVVLSMDELVSIIMPSYNTAKYIGDSIQSVLDQTYTNWELIIVDDCSTDDTDEVIKAFLADDRIRYFKNNNNSGAAVSRNLALKEAKGKWIAFLDSDDLWKNDKLQKQIHFMKENNYFFSYTRYYEINENGKANGIHVTGPKRISKNGFYNYCWVGCLTVMYDSSKIGLVQIADIKKNNDYAMWLKVCKKANCYLLDEELAMYRRGRIGSVSTHGLAILIKWHYYLWKEAENKNKYISIYYTMLNLFYGMVKKAIYVKNEK